MAARITAHNVLEIETELEARPAVARTAARISINSVANRQAVPMFRKSMREEVAFPPGYLEDKDRFGVTKNATDADLTAAITARFRPTSLARFSQGSVEGARRTGGVNVRVNRSGGAKRIKKAFFVRLRRGRDTQDGFNLGLAIRLKPGETLRGRRKGVTGIEIAPGLALLYGPSVDQVFRQTSVAESPKVADDLQREFIRQYVRLAGQK